MKTLSILTALQFTHSVSGATPPNAPLGAHLTIQKKLMKGLPFTALFVTPAALPKAHSAVSNPLI